MKLLHINRTNPTKEILLLEKILSEGNESTSFSLDEEMVDYAKLVELIFSHDKVISWW
jgi:sulfur transfer complex TusBCD TusB component (DsrH family)